MTEGALSLFKKQTITEKSVKLHWTKLIKSPKVLKPAFSIPKMKQVAKLAEGMGKQVTGFTVNGDGGFTVTAVEPGTFTGSEPNPFDEVLK